MKILPTFKTPFSKNRIAPPTIRPASVNLYRCPWRAISVWNGNDIYPGGPPGDGAPTKISLSNARFDIPFNACASEESAFDNCKLMDHTLPHPPLCCQNPLPTAIGPGFHGGLAPAFREKSNVFCNLTSRAASGSRPAKIPALPVQKLPLHFRRCGILPRLSGWREDGGRKNVSRQVRQVRQGGGWSAGGKSSRGDAVARRAWRGRILHKRTKRKQKGRLECGRKVSIENHENRFADMEKGSKAAVQSGRGRPAREAAGRRKTSGKGNVFRNLITRGRCWGKMKKSRPPRGRCLFGYVGPVQGGCGEGGGWWRGGYSRPKRRKSFEVSPEAMPWMEMEVPETVTAASVASRHVPESRSSVT